MMATRRSRSRGDEGEWIVYKGDVPINEFLKTNRPSLIEKSRHPWIAVYYPQRPPRKAVDEDALLSEWDKGIRTPWRVNADFVRQLAEKYSYKSGKWLIYSASAQIDEIWKSVAAAVVSRSLGHAAKVSPRDREKNTHVICVYTEDFTNKEQVQAVEKGLRKIGVTSVMSYKADVYTTLGIYRDNPWRLKPTIYSSRP